MQCDPEHAEDTSDIGRHGLAQHNCKSIGLGVPTAEQEAADTRSMLRTALRFFLLRFLPRRLIPILTAVEIVRLIQRLRRGAPEPVRPRRLVTSGTAHPEAEIGPDRAV